jgi:hypothetical protein
VRVLNHLVGGERAARQLGHGHVRVRPHQLANAAAEFKTSTIRDEIQRGWRDVCVSRTPDS